MEPAPALAQPSTGVRGPSNQSSRKPRSWQGFPPEKTRWTTAGPLHDAYLLSEQQDLELFLLFRTSEQSEVRKKHRKRGAQTRRKSCVLPHRMVMSEVSSYLLSRVA